MEAAFREGSFLAFDYPRHNYRGVRSHFERRRFRIDRVRDTEKEPVEQEALSADPLLNRGRVLLTGVDLDKNAERSFYVHAMLNIEPIGSPTFAGKVEAPGLFAVVELATNRVVARCLSQPEAHAFAKQWAGFHGMTCTVTEPIPQVRPRQWPDEHDADWNLASF